MDRTQNNPQYSDEDLVAFLDGELTVRAHKDLEAAVAQDNVLAARVAALRQGIEGVGTAFDAVLGVAPEERLKHLFATADAENRMRNLKADNDQTGWKSFGAAAATWAAILCGGALIGVSLDRILSNRDLPGLTQTAQKRSEDGASRRTMPAAELWRQVVADYHALFTKDSFSNDGVSRRSLRQALRGASTWLGRRVQRRQLDVASLRLRRSQILSMRGMRLVQIGYLTADGTPLSFCIIKAGMPNAEIADEVRNGLSISHWVSNGYGFLLIGDLPNKQVNEIASVLKERFT